LQHRDNGTTFTFPVRVAQDGTVTHDPLDFDPHALPWVTGAEDTPPRATREKYPEGREQLKKALSVLKSKRAQNGAAPRENAWAGISGMNPQQFEDPTGSDNR
jgi:hypothetical protein